MNGALKEHLCVLSKVTWVIQGTKYWGFMRYVIVIGSELFYRWSSEYGVIRFLGHE